MSYFAPYIDASGIHMPTYEERLADLAEAYRSIFGPDAALSASVPDYQLLSVFAKALDDASALVLQAYNSRNPAYASGNALDLLLPQYGLTRAAGETDASVRARIRTALSGRGTGTADTLAAALKALDGVTDARVCVNDGNTADESGIPPHSLAAAVRGGEDAEIARTVWNRKAPGIGTWGSVTVNVPDAQGTEHPVSFTRCEDKLVFAYVFIRLLEGGTRDTVRDALTLPLAECINGLEMAAPLNVPQLYGVAYNADPEIARTFVVTDIQIGVSGEINVIRDIVPCAWNRKITTLNDGGIIVYFS